MKRILVTVGVSVLAGSAWGQSLDGLMQLEARCGSRVESGWAMGTGSRSAHGECPSPRTGGLASINDASGGWTIAAGELAFDASAHTDFFGTNDDAGTASAQQDMIWNSFDLVFRDTADPTRTGTVRTRLHYLVGGRVEHLGASNCNPFQPSARSSINFQLGPCRGRGSLQYQPDTGEVSDGDFAALPHDGVLRERTSAELDVTLASPQQVFIQTQARGSVLYCDLPPAAEGLARALLGWRLPCGSPVFDLPPGITVDCPSLGIVDNRWTGCCPADFNGDGFLDFFDYDDFVNCFETGVCPAGATGDFNGDGFADFFDYDAFVGAFEAGC